MNLVKYNYNNWKNKYKKEVEINNKIFITLNNNFKINKKRIIKVHYKHNKQTIINI